MPRTKSPTPPPPHAAYARAARSLAAVLVDLKIQCHHAPDPRVDLAIGQLDLAQTNLIWASAGDEAAELPLFAGKANPPGGDKFSGVYLAYDLFDEAKGYWFHAVDGMSAMRILNEAIPGSGLALKGLPVREVERVKADYPELPDAPGVINIEVETEIRAEEVQDQAEEGVITEAPADAVEACGVAEPPAKAPIEPKRYRASELGIDRPVDDRHALGEPAPEGFRRAVIPFRFKSPDGYPWYGEEVLFVLAEDRYPVGGAHEQLLVEMYPLERWVGPTRSEDGWKVIGGGPFEGEEVFFDGQQYVLCDPEHSILIAFPPPPWPAPQPDGSLDGAAFAAECNVAAAEPPAKRKAPNPSFDVIHTADGENAESWLGRVYDAGSAEEAGRQADLAFYGGRGAGMFEVRKAAARYSQEVIHAGGKKMRRFGEVIVNLATRDDYLEEPTPLADPVPVPRFLKPKPTADLDTPIVSADRGNVGTPREASRDAHGINTTAAFDLAKAAERSRAVREDLEIGAEPTIAAPGIGQCYKADEHGEFAYDVDVEDDHGQGDYWPYARVHALSLPQATAKARELVDQGPETEGCAIRVEPTDMAIGGKRAKVAECVACGKRWPKSEGVGCPDCVHGPAPAPPAKLFDVRFSKRLGDRKHGSSYWYDYIGQVEAVDDAAALEAARTKFADGTVGFMGERRPIEWEHVFVALADPKDDLKNQVGSDGRPKTVPKGAEPARVSADIKADRGQLEPNLRRATEGSSIAAEKWAALRESGASDEQIRGQLGHFWSAGWGSAGDDHVFRTRGGAWPAIWFGDKLSEKPSLTGKPLIEAVRRLLEIPRPEGTKPPRKSPTRTFRATYHDPANDGPVDLGLMTGFSRSDAIARLPQAFADHTVDVAGAVVPIDPAKIRLTPEPTRAKRKGVPA